MQARQLQQIEALAESLCAHDNDHADPVYLDYNATTPLLPSVAAAMMRAMTFGNSGNPSSSHVYGRRAKSLLTTARMQVAAMLGRDVTADEILFQSGATESVNYVVRGVVANALNAGDGTQPVHIVTSNIEHVVVKEVCAQLAAAHPTRVSVTYVPCDADGRVTLAAFERAMTSTTTLVTIMLANNEVGAVNDIGAIARYARTVNPDIVVHTDASQACGKIPVDVDALAVDYLTVAGHKLYAPKGIGALYMRATTLPSPLTRTETRPRPMLPSLIVGAASHESGRRSGTENVILAVALGAACAAFTGEERARAATDVLRRRRDLLYSSFVTALVSRLRSSGGGDDDAGSDGDGVSDEAALPHVIDAYGALPDDVRAVFRVNGPVTTTTTQLLPNTLSLGVAGVAASQLLAAVSDVFCASAGSACHSDSGDGGGGDGDGHQVSAVLTAMAVPRDYAVGTVRLSVGRMCTDVQMRVCGAALADAVVRLRSERGL